MADCYYHGPTGSGPCPDCEYNRKYNLDRGEVRSLSQIEHDDKIAANDQARKAHKRLPYPGLTPRKKTNAWGNWVG